MNNGEVRPTAAAGTHPILFYDGVCGLCNRMVQFVLRRDANGVFRFAALQSGLAQSVLPRHGANPADLDTVYVVVNRDPAKRSVSGQAGDEELLARSDAVLFVARQLGGIWRAGAWLAQLLPRTLRDWAYAIVARSRYRIFGRYDACALPSEATRERFLDI